MITKKKKLSKIVCVCLQIPKARAGSVGEREKRRREAEDIESASRRERVCGWSEVRAEIGV